MQSYLEYLLIILSVVLLKVFFNMHELVSIESSFLCQGKKFYGTTKGIPAKKIQPFL